MPKMLKGTGDFHPPEDEDLPVCRICEGSGVVTDGCVSCGSAGCDGAHWEDCPNCNGTGYQPEPEFDPGIEVDE